LGDDWGNPQPAAADWGVCGDPRGEGEPCLPLSEDCRIDLFCDASRTQPVCAQQAPLGSECRNPYGCKDSDCVGLIFDAQGHLYQVGRCEPYLDLGDRCDQGGSCANDAACDPVSRTCQKYDYQPFLNLGDACSPATDLCNFGDCDITSHRCV